MKLSGELYYTPLYPEHILKLEVHPVQTDEYNALLAFVRANPDMPSCTGVTAWVGGVCIGMAGVFQLWEGRAEAWTLLSAHAADYILRIIPKIGYVLDSVPFRRVEMTVRVHNRHGHKLAKHLGFGGSQRVALPNGRVVAADGLLRAYWPTQDGADDVVMYSRIKTP